MRKRDLWTQGYPPFVRVFKTLFAQRSALRHFKYRQVRIFGETESTKIGQVFKDRKALAVVGMYIPHAAGIWRSSDGQAQ